MKPTSEFKPNRSDVDLQMFREGLVTSMRIGSWALPQSKFMLNFGL